MDINVLPVWRKGYTGKGIVVSILDDGGYWIMTETIHKNLYLPLIDYKILLSDFHFFLVKQREKLMLNQKSHWVLFCTLISTPNLYSQYRFKF